MAVIELPTRTDVPHYSFEIELDRRLYSFEFHWNDRGGGWHFTISDPNTAAVLLAGRRVVVDFPLLSRFRDERLPAGELCAVDTTGEKRGPGIADLGARVKLLYFDAADLPAAFVG